MRKGRSNFESVVIGTVLVHVVLLTLLDIGGTWARRHPIEPEPDPIELEDTPPPPPPPPQAKAPPPPPPPVKAPEVKAPPPPSHHVATAPPRAAEPAHPATPNEPPPDPSQPPVPGGGQDAYRLPDGPTGGIAVPVGHGHGTGGTGRGTGGGSGDAQGSGTAPVAVSVAAIKVKAKPRGDYSYFGAGKDYPPEAKQLGVEGVIRVRLLVDATGKVKSRTLLNKLGHGLDELALERAKKIVFDPAKDTDDKPVSSVVIWTFNMTLPK